LFRILIPRFTTSTDLALDFSKNIFSTKYLVLTGDDESDSISYSNPE